MREQRRGLRSGVKAHTLALKMRVEPFPYRYQDRLAHSRVQYITRHSDHGIDHTGQYETDKKSDEQCLVSRRENVVDQGAEHQRQQHALKRARDKK